MIRDLYALDSEREIVDSIDFLSIIWTAEYYNTGDFSIKVPDTKKNRSILVNVEYISRPDDPNIGVIENIHMENNGSSVITITGRFAKSILDRRIIAHPTNIWGGTSNNIYRIAIEGVSGNVENSIKLLVSQNAGPTTLPEYRKIPFLKVEANQGFTSQFANARQITGANLLEYTNETLQEFGLGSRIVLVGSDFVYQIYKGKDRTQGNSEQNAVVVFGENHDNISFSEKNYDNSQKKNVALIGGCGEGSERLFAVLNWEVYNNLDTEHRGINRREIFVDARDISKTYMSGNDTLEYSDLEYNNMLTERGKTDLADRKEINEYSGDIDLTNSPYKYRRDFDLGDIVNVIDDDGIVDNKRIVTVSEVQDKNGYDVKPSFDNV